MKKRIAISNIIILIILIISKPSSITFFFIGLFFVTIGQIIRLLSSATIVKSKTLTTKGIYSLCRNPLYLGTLTITFGILIQLSSNAILNTFIIWLIAIPSFAWIYSQTIKAEESFLLSIYGKDFQNYLASTPSLMPKLSAWPEIFVKGNYDITVFKKNKEYRGIAGSMAIEVIVLLKIYYAF